jgi:hypothetical protein
MIANVMTEIPQRFVNAALNLAVSHSWIGHGSALFIELGRLSTRRKLSGRPGHPEGRVTLMIELSWRIERARSILGGSWSSERRWRGMIAKLEGNSVTEIRSFATLPESEVSFSNGMRVVSFMTAEGLPSWSLIAGGLGESSCDADGCASSRSRFVRGCVEGRDGRRAEAP